MTRDEDRTAALMTPAMLAQLRMKPKPDAAPGAWLNQMASDAGSGHARRLVDLHQQLLAQARERDVAAMQEALRAAAEELVRVDLARVQPKGWLARATGRGKEEASAFIGQVDRMNTALEQVEEQVHALRKKHQTQTAALERSLAEFDTEVQAVEGIIDQGARWLQDMRGQLRVRQTQAPDAAAQEQIAEDTERCELLVVRMKQLRAANSAAQHARELCQSAAARRAKLLEHLQQLLEGEARKWQQCLSPLAEQAARSGATPDAMEPARAAGTELEAALKQAAKDCRQLARQDGEFVEELTVLARPLEAAA